MTVEKEKKHVCVRITPELFDVYWKTGKDLFSIFENIPDDTNFVRSRIIDPPNKDTRCIEFILESSHFDPLSKGSLIPVVTFIVTKHISKEKENKVLITVPNAIVKLGDKALDTISGFVGIVTARCEYISGCIQFCLTPKCNKDGKLMEGHYFDDKRVMKIFVPLSEEKPENTKEYPSGGPQSNTPTTR